MDKNHFIIAAVASIVAAYLMADRFYRQGYPFWRIFLLGVICVFGIILTFVAAILGKS